MFITENPNEWMEISINGITSADVFTMYGVVYSNSRCVKSPYKPQRPHSMTFSISRIYTQCVYYTSQHVYAKSVGIHTHMYGVCVCQCMCRNETTAKATTTMKKRRLRRRWWWCESERISALMEIELNSKTNMAVIR